MTEALRLSSNHSSASAAIWTQTDLWNGSSQHCLCFQVIFARASFVFVFSMQYLLTAHIPWIDFWRQRFSTEAVKYYRHWSWEVLMQMSKIKTRRSWVLPEAGPFQSQGLLCSPKWWRSDVTIVWDQTRMMPNSADGVPILTLRCLVQLVTSCYNSLATHSRESTKRNKSDCWTQLHTVSAWTARLFPVLTYTNTCCTRWINM